MIAKGSKIAPVALITGTSSGFGMLTAVKLAERGYQVIATMRDVSRQEELLYLAETKQVKEKISIYYLDVTSESSIKQTISTVIEDYNQIDVLVNNAGFAQGGFVEEVSMEAWRSQLETNVMGTIAVTKAVLPQMRKQQNGTVINISSVSGVMAFPGYAPYATSKFAIEGFSESLRLEMKPFGVHVVLIEPGSYSTNIWEKGFRSISREENSPYGQYLDTILSFSQKSAASQNDPWEVASLIAAVAGRRNPKLRYVTGKGSRLMLSAKALLPWSWIERTILKILSR